MKLSPDQREAIKSLNHGESVFLTGPAGSGKSELLREFIRQNPNRPMVRLASTGQASQLIGGQTMHSFFGLGTDIHTPHDLRMNDRLKGRLRATHAVIVEEISMARIDHFQAIRDRLYGAARGYGDYAGYQLIVAGDFAQMPPVSTEEEAKIIEARYGAGKRYAFQSRYWGGLKHIELSTIHRQAGDLVFAEWLNTMRRGEIPDLDFVNTRVGPAQPGSVHLVATNRAAERINEAAMAALPGGSYKIEGTVRDAFNDRNMRVPQTLRLKPGAQIVICANNTSAGYANGSTGTLMSCSRDKNGAPVANVMLDNGKQVVVSQAVWENVTYENNNGQVEKRAIGTYKQLPILPGWAITIHRSQGMSIDRLHVDVRGIFESGQAYVALSRATSLAGLTLETPLLEKHIIFDERVREFMNANTPEPAPQPC